MLVQSAADQADRTTTGQSVERGVTSRTQTKLPSRRAPGNASCDVVFWDRVRAPWVYSRKRILLHLRVRPADTCTRARCTCTGRDPFESTTKFFGGVNVLFLVERISLRLERNSVQAKGKRLAPPNRGLVDPTDGFLFSVLNVAYVLRITTGPARFLRVLLVAAMDPED